jgi:hypothetical protein
MSDGQKGVWLWGFCDSSKTYRSEKYAKLIGD